MLHHFHNFLLILLLLSSFMVIFVNNPVHSVLFLILSFCCGSAIAILFQVEFVGLLFIVIYVGALAILFLFVVMMLNVKTYSTWSSFSISIILSSIFLIGTRVYILISNIFQADALQEGVLLFDNLSNAVLFGQVLYNYNIIPFLLAGVLLLVAMVGSISITLTSKNDTRIQLAHRQLSRSNAFTSFFK